MELREFIKITKWKIILTLLIPLSFNTLSYLNQFILKFMPLLITIIKYPLDIINDTCYSGVVFTNTCYSPIYYVTFIRFILIFMIINYLISCIIFALINKIKNKK